MPSVIRPLPSPTYALSTIHEPAKSQLKDVTNLRSNRSPSPPRPLPQLPQGLCCKSCKTMVTSCDAALSSSSPGHREFRGFDGKASLFKRVQNIKLLEPKKMLMATGCHTLQQIDCSVCESQYLGFKIVRSCDESERWKEGNYLLELESLANPLSMGLPDLHARSSSPENHSRSSSPGEFEDDFPLHNSLPSLTPLRRV